MTPQLQGEKCAKWGEHRTEVTEVTEGEWVRGHGGCRARSARIGDVFQPQKVTTVRTPMTAALLDPFWALGFQIY